MSLEMPPGSSEQQGERHASPLEKASAAFQAVHRTMLDNCVAHANARDDATHDSLAISILSVSGCLNDLVDATFLADIDTVERLRHVTGAITMESQARFKIFSLHSPNGVYTRMEDPSTSDDYEQRMFGMIEQHGERTVYATIKEVYFASLSEETKRFIDNLPPFAQGK